MLCYAMLCYAMLYSTLLYSTLLYYTILYYTIDVVNGRRVPTDPGASGLRQFRAPPQRLADTPLLQPQRDAQEAWLSVVATAIIHTNTHIYTYIYIERESEREREGEAERERERDRQHACATRPSKKQTGCCP